MPSQVLKPFNSTVEIALRAMFLLAATAPSKQSIQRLVYFDYLTIHSNDIVDGPDSIHPPIPNRTGEWLLRRETLQKALGLLIQRELASVTFEESGIYFSATKLTEPFIEYFQSDYSVLLKERAAWVSKKFGPMSENELAAFMNSHIATWGTTDIHVKRSKLFGG